VTLLRSLAGNVWVRVAVVLAMVVSVLLALWWQGPDWDVVYHSFDFVSWRWIVAAVFLNLLSILARALSWNLTIRQALPEPHPAFIHVFSGFSVGLLGNAVLPARAGELARVAALRRHVDHGPGTSATLIGTVFAHRLFDLFPVSLLVLYIIVTAKIPHWAVTGLVGFGLVGVALLAVAVLSARRSGMPVQLDSLGTIRRLWAMARQGLAVLRNFPAAVAAVLFQTGGWVLQLFAVWAVTKAFDMHVPLSAAALVLLLMNVATIFPLWPGNIGLLQAAVALPLRQYGVAYGTGFACGLVLQAIEMSVGVGVGLVFLAREGLSFASLRRGDAAADTSSENALAGDGEDALDESPAEGALVLVDTPGGQR
jgi:glycosyltransferase 2 family protein